MKSIGVTLIVVGAIGILIGTMMFGDIKVAAWIGGASALLSGVGFVKAEKEISK